MTRNVGPTILARILPDGYQSATTFIYGFLSLVLIILSTVNPASVSSIRTTVNDLGAPAIRAISWPVRNGAAFLDNLGSLTHLSAENKRLMEENERLREWYQTALLLQAENESLKNLLKVKAEAATHHITARVLADNGGAFAQTLLLNAGKRDGIAKGQAVLSGDGLIGRIIETGETTSRVLLVTDINSRIPVLIENTSQNAILAGTNDSYPELLHVSEGNHIDTGARIITSGHGGALPKGLPVGRISLDHKNRPRIKLFSDLSRLVYVRVVDRRVEQSTLSPVIN